MPDREEIISLKDRYITLYGQVREGQEIDNTYIEDTFAVPEIVAPHTLYRAGIGDRIVNAPAEHIITSNPQVFFYPKKKTKGAQESADRLSEVVNGHWLPLLQKQNPNIFKEFIKNLLGRGEAFFQCSHNNAFRHDKKYLPIKFLVPDPMVVYASPDESMDGIPEKVVIYYQIAQYQELIPKYEELKKIKDLLEAEKQANWLEYHDAESRYVEVSETPLTKGGVQRNIYKFTPFVRKYSGFGRRSPSGELSSLIVSDIRRSRDLVREECATRSNIASIEYLFAHKPKTFIGEGLTAEKIRDNYSPGQYDINAIDADPSKIKIEEIDITPSPETYKHHADLINELNQRHPFILAGFPMGSSGRQQDMTETSAMRRYDSVVQSCEHAFATAIWMALQIIQLPGYRPDSLTEQDLKTEFDIEVRLKAKDPIAEERRVTMGNRLFNGGNGVIDLGTLHTEYLGLTQFESKRIKANILTDRITLYNPDIQAVLGMVAAEEYGLESWLEKAAARASQMEKSGLMEQMPASQEQRVAGEVETDQGLEEATPRGARQAPSGYNRGG